MAKKMPRFIKEIIIGLIIVVVGGFILYKLLPTESIVETSGNNSPGVVEGDYIEGDKFMGDKNVQVDEKPYIIPQSIIKGVLPILVKKRLPGIKAFGETLEQTEYGLYLIVEVSTENQPINLSHIILEGELFLNGNEYLTKHENVGKTIPNIIKEMGEKKPYYRIKWVTSSPVPKRLEKNQTALTLFTLKEPDLSQVRSFVSKIGDEDALENYIGYKNPPREPKWESTHPNIQEFLETKIENNKPYFSNIRKDFTNENIKWYLIIEQQRILIPAEKIKPIKDEYLSQGDDFPKTSLEGVYHREWY